MILQPIIDLAELCVRHGVTRAVVSPGSRSAALTLAFARNSRIECTVVMDERAAGFIALGMAQQLRKPVVLICTSGSAAYNFAPAVAEAFFQQIPLVVLTADRPPEWINQNDGQTIFQENIFGRHVKQRTTLPSDYAHPDSVWYINRVVNESLLTCQDSPAGPVHLNIPIREPFYPESDELYRESPGLRVITRMRVLPDLASTEWHKIKKEWEGSQRILIAVGQLVPSDDLRTSLNKLQEKFQIPVVGDCISNLSTTKWSVAHQDLLFLNKQNTDLGPDLLITIGQSFISKNFKRFLQNNKTAKHWNISEDVHVIDTFFSLTDQILMSPVLFFNRLVENLEQQNFIQNGNRSSIQTYFAKWSSAETKAKRVLTAYMRNLTMLNDLTAVGFVLRKLPKDSQLQIANSMAIRYVNALGIEGSDIKVFCNRGTSGIDGCVSTAIGAAKVTKELVFLLVGDVAFFYDRNGLLVENFPLNLKIILLNNTGGTIFRMIDGPAKQPELETYFETRHAQNARKTSEDSGLPYFLVEDIKTLNEIWGEFIQKETACILEIKTDPVESTKVYKALFAYEEKA